MPQADVVKYGKFYVYTKKRDKPTYFFQLFSERSYQRIRFQVDDASYTDFTRNILFYIKFL